MTALREHWGTGKKDLAGLRVFFTGLSIIMEPEDVSNIHNILDLDNDGFVELKEVTLFLVSSRVYSGMPKKKRGSYKVVPVDTDTI